jgi:DNA-binding NarL/FixJ family response regulator
MSTPKIKVIIADDHDMFRDGFKQLLIKQTDIELLAEASTGKKLVELAKLLHPDVIITDLKMPDMDGVSAIKAIRNAGLTTRFIALSTFDYDQLIVDALEAGALGYILKNAQRGEVIEAIKTVYDSKPFYCRMTTSKLARKIMRSRFNPYTKSYTDLFNDIEKRIICLICEEKTNEEIADIVCLSKRTIEGYRIKIMDKMEVKSGIGVAVCAIKSGIYEIDDLPLYSIG